MLSMKVTIRQALLRLKEDFKNDTIFMNHRQFRAALNDVKIEDDEKRVRNLLNVAIRDLQAYTRLKSGLTNNTFIIDTLTAEMSSDHAIDKKTAQIVIECIAELLGYVSPILQAEQTIEVNKSIDTPKKDDVISFGSYEWRVLDVENDKALIITKDIIMKGIYHNKSITWEKCHLRNYFLNAILYDEFAPEEQQRIILTDVRNSDNEKYGTKGGNDTQDKIFLLSIDEAKNLFEDDVDRKATYKSANSWWWLRSPGLGDFYAATVLDDGFIQFTGSCVYDETVGGGGGIRPAMWIRM
jgi:hypothetical protein